MVNVSEDFGSTILFTDKPHEMINFYRKVLQKEPNWTGGDFQGFELGVEMLFIGPHTDVLEKKNETKKAVIDLETDDVGRELSRIKQIEGIIVLDLTRRVRESKAPKITLSDPDGNFLRLGSQ